MTFFDWSNYFLPATLATLRGQNPTAIIFNAPWVTLPLLPFALWGETGAWLNALATLIALGYIAYRMKAEPLGLIALFSVPYTLGMLQLGNIEWLALLGLVMPPSVGMLFLAIKPQMTIGVMIFWVWRAYRSRQLIKTVLPLILTTSLSFALYGVWVYDRTLNYLQYINTGNASLFPYSLPFGLALMVAGLRRNDFRFALAASPCFFPVLTPQSWLAPMLALVSMPYELLAASLGIWAMGILPSGRG